MQTVSLDKLLETGTHFGHQSKRWNPKMAPYLYGVVDGVHVFDLVKTKEALETALDFIKKSVSEGKILLLLGAKKQAKSKIIEIGQKTGTAYISERWLGGTLSNFPQLEKSIKKLAEMKANMASGEYSKFTKKERLLLEREITRLERFFSGISTLTKVPDILFVVDIHKEIAAVLEARQKGTTIIGLVDSNSDPDLVDYVIPMNDDALAAVEYALDLVGEAIEDGKKKIK